MAKPHEQPGDDEEDPGPDIHGLRRQKGEKTPGSDGNETLQHEGKRRPQKHRERFVPGRKNEPKQSQFCPAARP